MFRVWEPTVLGTTPSLLLFLGDCVPRSFGSPPFDGKNRKNRKIEYSSRIFNSFYLNKLKTMEYNKFKIINHINDKRAEILRHLKLLKFTIQKENYCEKNYKNFLDNALINHSSMSEKDSLKFFRLGAQMNETSLKKKEIIQKLEAV